MDKKNISSESLDERRRRAEALADALVQLPERVQVLFEGAVMLAQMQQVEKAG